MTDLRPWWETYPSVLQAEEAGLERLGGRRPELNDDLLANAGIREYLVIYQDDDGSDYQLTVTYSDFHPFFAPRVTTDHRFGNHQEPFGGTLCLLRGGTTAWDVGETAAAMIAEQMPKLLRDRRDVPPTDTAYADAEPAGAPHASAPASVAHVEPYVGYYTYADPTAVRVDGAWAPLDEADHGRLTVGVEGHMDVGALRGIVVAVADAAGSTLRECDPAVIPLFGTTIAGRWCRLSSRPDADGGRAVLDAAIAEQPDLARPDFQVLPGGQVDVIGVVFTDDLDADLTTGAVRRGHAWMFVVRARPTATTPRAPVRGGRGGRGGRTTPTADRPKPYLARSIRAGRADVAARVPTLHPVAEKTIALIGTGAIGAPSAVEFAKAGAKTLRIVEFDALDAGNAVRWPLGYLGAGHHKLSLLQSHLTLNWPYTKTEPHSLWLGNPRDARDPDPQWQILDTILDGADLIYDASAAPGVTYFLSELAAERQLPYVVVTATEGGWGGYAARFGIGDGQACWRCLMHHFEDDPDLLPPADPDPATRDVWPAGCTDPTFTGTGFDIAAMAHAGVRLAVSTLTDGYADAYPQAAWNYARYSFRDRDHALPGHAEAKLVGTHPRCRRCGR